jgi:hypothetical protein
MQEESPHSQQIDLDHSWIIELKVYLNLIKKHSKNKKGFYAIKRGNDRDKNENMYQDILQTNISIQLQEPT